MTSTLLDVVRSSPKLADEFDMVAFDTSSKDMILALPAIPHLDRDESIIPDVPIKIILSKSQEMPRYVLDHLEKTNDQRLMTVATEGRLGGLCLSGLSAQPEIFVHSETLADDVRMPGYTFDDITWHELLHSIEGIKISESGEIKRVTPLSYLFQQAMIEVDEKDKDTSPWYNNELYQKNRGYFSYLRSGAVSQEHTSELFARYANVFLQQIRVRMEMPKTRSELIEFFSIERMITLSKTATPDEGSNNAYEIFLTVASFGTKALSIFFDPDLFSKYLNQFTKIYGYDYQKNASLNP